MTQTGLLHRASTQLKKAAKVRMRKCRVCKTPFPKLSMRHVACSSNCAILIAQEARKKAERKDIAVRKMALKSRSQWLAEAQAVFNQYIRARDANLPCISCGRFHEGAWDAGHYRSVGSIRALRFNEDNCHRQCVPCNQHKAGNVVEYRIGLKMRIGEERLAFLEGPHLPAKYTIEDAKAIKVLYKAKLKDAIK